jgi:hypothetical protein
MAESSLTTLIGDEIQGRDKWSDFVDGGDGFFYGIPFDARRVVKFNPLDKSFTDRRVVKFNPLDKSFTEIGPDFDGFDKWRCGVRASNTGSI